MGQDLIIDYISVKHKLTHGIDGEDKAFWSKLRKAYHGKLGKFSKKQYEDLEAETGTNIDKVSATAIVEEVFDILGGCARDVAWIVIPAKEPITIFITGGMSWGDDPTDSFHTFNTFNTLFPYNFIDDVLDERLK